MKIRITGTLDELATAESYYRALEHESYIQYVCVSRAYKNRGSTTLYRLYVDIEYNNNFKEKKYGNRNTFATNLIQSKKD